MNASTSSVLPLTAIAFLYTPKEWLNMFGIDNAMDILTAQRQAKSRREVLTLKDELEPERPDHNHHPVQHRDGKPPWCKECGMTTDGREPVSMFQNARRIG